MSDERVIEKVNKLLRLAEKAGTAEEAELAFSKAQELMVKHAIDEARLGLTAERREQIVTRRVPLRERDEIIRAKMHLFNQLAAANQCKIVDATRTHGQVWIVGYESQAQFVELLAASILIQYAGERTREWKAYQSRYTALGLTPPESRFRWVNAFAFGYAQRVGERVKEMSTTTAAKSKGGELVLRDRKADVEDWMSQNMSLGKGRTRRVSGSAEARMQGRRAAEHADISGGRNNVRTGARRSLGR